MSFPVDRLERMVGLVRTLVGLAIVLLVAGFTFGAYLATLSFRVTALADSMLTHNHPTMIESQRKMADNQRILRLMMERLGQKTGTTFDDLTKEWNDPFP